MISITFSLISRPIELSECLSACLLFQFPPPPPQPPYSEVGMSVLVLYNFEALCEQEFDQFVT